MNVSLKVTCFPHLHYNHYGVVCHCYSQNSELMSSGSHLTMLCNFALNLKWCRIAPTVSRSIGILTNNNPLELGLSYNAAI